MNSETIITPRIVFLGSPMIDIITATNDTIMKKYNLEEDCAYSITHTGQDIFDDVALMSPVIKVGGTATNTARILKKYIKIPNYILYLGAIGCDHYGDLIKQQLDKDAINYEFIEWEKERTGKVIVLLKGRKRTLISDLGASKKFPETYLNGKLWDLVTSCKYFYFSSFFIGASWNAVKKITDYFYENGKIVAFNLGATFLTKKFPTQMMEIYKIADLIFGNEAEHRAFAAISQEISGEIADIVIETNRKYADNLKSRIIIVTRGDKSVWVINNNEATEYQVELVKNVVNTNGAGDALVGGFLASYIRGKTIDECVQQGIEAALKVVQGLD